MRLLCAALSGTVTVGSEADRQGVSAVLRLQEVRHVDIIKESLESGRSKVLVYATVKYASSADAQRAVAKLNNTVFMGRLIFVSEDPEDVGRGGGGRRGGFSGLDGEFANRELRRMQENDTGRVGCSARDGRGKRIREGKGVGSGKRVPDDVERSREKERK